MSEPLSRAAHDLRNPLAVVRATLEWLGAQLGAASPAGEVAGACSREDILEGLRDASAATDRLTAIVGDLETLAALEVPGDVARASVSLGEVVAQACARARPLLDARRVAVEMVGFGGPELVTSGDEVLLVRAVETFVDLSVRASRPGACVALSVTAAAGAVVLEIGPRDETCARDRAPRDPRELPGLSSTLAVRILALHGAPLVVHDTDAGPRVAIRFPRVV